MNFEGFESEIIQKIIEIEKKYGFEENYLFIRLSKLLKFDIRVYEDKTIRRKNQRSLNSFHAKLKAIQEQIKQLKTDLQSIPKTPVVLLSGPHGVLHNELINILQQYEISLSEKIASIKDKGGRLPGSLKQFLITNLLHIYSQGTNKAPQCGWDTLNDIGKGEAYNFLIQINALFLEINSQYALGTDQTICISANKIYRTYMDAASQDGILSLFSTT